MIFILLSSLFINILKICTIIFLFLIFVYSTKIKTLFWAKLKDTFDAYNNMPIKPTFESIQILKQQVQFFIKLNKYF